MDDWPSTPATQDLRNVVSDLHHGLRQRRVVGDADAIAHVLDMAARAGVPEGERQQMATEQFRRLLEATAPRARKPWQRWRRPVRIELGHVEQLPQGRELPPPSMLSDRNAP